MITLQLSTDKPDPKIPALKLYPTAPSDDLSRLAENANFKNKFAELLVTNTELFVGVGDRELDSTNARKLAGRLARSMSHLRQVRIDFDLPHAQSFFEGLLLGGFDQRLYGSKEIPETTVFVSNEHSSELDRAVLVADAVNQARKIINTPGNHMFPEVVANMPPS
jgi:Leucyl aminopeptidase